MSNRLIMLLCTACLTALMGKALAATSPEERFIDSKVPFAPVIRVAGERKENTIEAISAAIRVLKSPIHVEELYGDEGTSFVFISAKNAIIEGVIQLENISFLDDSFATAIASFKSDSDTCAIQRFKLRLSHSTIVAVHTDANPTDEAESVYQCFTVALWYYMYGSVENIDPDNWRGMIKGILSEL